jgi:hypothetical protein
MMAHWRLRVPAMNCGVMQFNAVVLDAPMVRHVRNIVRRVAPSLSVQDVGIVRDRICPVHVVVVRVVLLRCRGRLERVKNAPTVPD